MKQSDREGLKAMGKLLFPISVGNRRFSSERVAGVLRPLLRRNYQEYVFLIADKPHLFNRARHIKKDGDLDSVLTSFRYKNRELQGKRAWLRNLKAVFDSESLKAPWRVISSDDVADARFIQIHRALLISYATAPKFRKAVGDAASNFVRGKFGDSHRPEWVELSRDYILEEIALNVRVRAWERIHTEYYLGQHHQPLLGVYRGDYGFSLSTLTGLEISGSDFSFFELQGDKTESPRLSHEFEVL